MKKFMKKIVAVVVVTMTILSTSTTPVAAKGVVFKNLNQAAKKVTAGTRSKNKKVEKIFRFVNLNIAYDESRGTSRSFNDIKVLRTRKANSYEKAAMMELMCESVGIKSRVISGTADGEPWSWVIVKQDGEWVGYDPTYGPVISKNVVYEDDYDYDYELGAEVDDEDYEDYEEEEEEEDEE